MKSQSYSQTPRCPLSQSMIKRNFFTLISKAQFDKIFKEQFYIGSGVQGQVYSAIFEGGKVAIKYFKREALGADLINYIQNEIQSLDELSHRNILSLIFTYQVVMSNSLTRFCLVTEYCESSFNNFEIIQPLSDFQKLTICSELMSGINAAHQKKIMHRDIKPDNILIKDLESMEIKIADFGCSTMRAYGNNNSENINMTRFIGTPLYSDPNITGGRYSVKCDIYSAGLVIVYIFCGQHFFSNCRTQKQLIKAKEKFTSDIISSALDFLENFTDEEVSPRIKSFLVEIANFTMANDENNRHSAAELLDFINNQLAHFETQDLKSSEINSSPKKSHQQSQIRQNSHSKQNRISSDIIIIGQHEESYSEDMKMKKYSTAEESYDSFHSLEKYHSQSEITIQTADKSQKYGNHIQQNSFQNFKQDISYEKSSQMFNSNHQIQLNDLSLDSPHRELSKNYDESSNKSQNNQISFISSDSNEFQKKWNKKQKAQGYSSRIFKDLKSSSSILDSRINKIRSRKSIEDQSMRQSRIDQKEKTLTESQKLCSLMIRYGFESSGINEQGEMMNKILSSFNSIKKNFEVVQKIGQIIESPFTKEQKITIAFFFHFMYAGKLKDIRSFALGKSTNLKLQFTKISSKRRESICKIVDSELERIFKNLKEYSNDLRKKVDLIKPRLSQFTRNCINEAFKCTMPADWLTITYKEAETKQETRNFIKEKESVTKNDKEIEILKELTHAIGRMCQ